jgi:hypothetical protein
VYELLQQLPVTTGTMTPDVRQNAFRRDGTAGIGKQQLHEPHLKRCKVYRLCSNAFEHQVINSQ